MSQRVESEATTISPTISKLDARERTALAEATPTVPPPWQPSDHPTEMQQMYLRRLRRLVALERICERNLDPTEPEVGLTRWAIYSTLCACRSLGGEEAARQVLRLSAAARTHRSGRND